MCFVTKNSTPKELPRSGLAHLLRKKGRRTFSFTPPKSGKGRSVAPCDAAASSPVIPENTEEKHEHVDEITHSCHHLNISSSPKNGYVLTSRPFDPKSTTPLAPATQDQTAEAYCKHRNGLPPGMTAKNHQRQFVHHDYHDHSLDLPSEDEKKALRAYNHPCSHDSNNDKHDVDQKQRGGVTTPFPIKLHEMLNKIEADGHANIISWQPHGRCFLVHHPKEFVDKIIQTYFRQTKLSSFQRQLNLYGFSRLTTGPDKGAYYHEYFLRERPFLINRMVRTRIKGTGVRTASSPDTEPDFYAMPAMPAMSEVYKMKRDEQEREKRCKEQEIKITRRNDTTRDKKINRPHACLLPSPTKSSSCCLSSASEATKAAFIPPSSPVRKSTPVVADHQPSSSLVLKKVRSSSLEKEKQDKETHNKHGRPDYIRSSERSTREKHHWHKGSFKEEEKIPCSPISSSTILSSAHLDPIPYKSNTTNDFGKNIKDEDLTPLQYDKFNNDVEDTCLMDFLNSIDLSMEFQDLATEKGINSEDISDRSLGYLLDQLIN